jgi:protein-tyrosine phosphatase
VTPRGALVDLHCHILPGIDDGARDLADSVAMARQAQADGIGIVCATPHIRHDHDVRIHELAERVAELNAALGRERVAVRVAIGGEVAETAVDGLDDEELRTVALGGAGGWVLLEPAPGPLGDSLHDAVALLRERGAGSVIAHPERHAGHDLAERLAALTREGALVQMTAALLEEGPAAETMLALAATGLVHVLGSDAHSSLGGRPVVLTRGLARLAELPELAPHIGWIAREAPAAILRGEPVAPPYAPA